MSVKRFGKEQNIIFSFKERIDGISAHEFHNVMENFMLTALSLSQSLLQVLIDDNLEDGLSIRI